MFKNTLKRLGAIVLALAMAMSVMMVSAFATNGIWSGTNNAAITSLTFKKTVTVEDQNVKAPNATFEFTVTPVAPDENEKRNSYPVSAGVAGGVSNSASVAFVPTDVMDTGTTTYTKDVSSLAFTASAFPAPGIYKYTVTEDDTTVDGITKDGTTGYLYVYVRNKTNEEGSIVKDADGKVVLEVYAAELVKVIGTDETKFDTFTNVYDTGTLTVSKKITGNQADLSSTWDITITIQGAVGESYATSDPNKVLTIGDNGQATITVTLGNDDTFEVYGLSQGDKYKVVEDAANTDGYTTNGEIKDLTALGVNQETSKANDVSVTIENHRNTTTPTGVIMNIAPYVLMVALAGGIAFFFLRRRNAE